MQPGTSEILLINYHAQAKDPAAGTMLSLFPGFGAGHFYSGSIKSGLVVAAGELVGLGLLLLSSAVGEPGDTSRDVLRAVGAGFFVAFKIGDVAYAPFAAKEHNVDLAMRLRVPIIGGDTRKGLVEDARPSAGGGDAGKKQDPSAPPDIEGFQY